MTAPVRGAQLSVPANMFCTCAAAEVASGKKKKTPLGTVFSPGFKMKCKGIYHLNMQIILPIFQFHMQYIRVSCGVFPYQIQIFSYFRGKTS